MNRSDFAGKNFFVRDTSFLMHRVEQWTEDADGVRFLGVKTNGITRPSIKRPIKHARSISLFSLSFRLSVRGTASVPTLFIVPLFFSWGRIVLLKSIGSAVNTGDSLIRLKPICRAGPRRRYSSFSSCSLRICQRPRLNVHTITSWREWK